MSSFSRSILLVEILADEPEGLPFGELCARLNLAKGSVHPMVQSLIASGYLERSKIDERLRLTMRLPSLGFRYLQSTRIVDVCQPILERCAAEAGELVQLGVVTGDAVVFSAWAQGANTGLQYTPVRGRNVPLHCTATGLAWLSSFDDHEVVRIVGNAGFGTPEATYTKNSITKYPDLFERLKKTRRQGYGISLEESTIGLNACAVPFPGGCAKGSKIVGLLGMAGPSFRLTEKVIESMIPLLKVAAGDLARVWPMREYLGVTEQYRGSQASAATQKGAI